MGRSFEFLILRQLLTDYFPALLEGASNTLILASCSWVIGVLVGVFLGFAISERKEWMTFFDGAGFVISTIPVLVLLFWFHYPLQFMANVVVDPMITSIAIFSTLNAVFVANTVAKTSREIAKDYREAAFVNGMSHRVMRRKVEIPLVLRTSSPSIISYQVVVLHMTLFASLISANELFRTAQRINSIEYQPVEIYSLLVIFYAAISAPLLVASRYFRSSNDRWQQ